MELWEFNNCVAAFNEQQAERSKEMTALAWQTANFVGAAFAGKLRKLSWYLDEAVTHAAPQVSKEEFERRLALAQEVNADGNRKVEC